MTHGVQVDEFTAPTAIEEVPAGHGTHPTAPLPALYVPELHMTHEAPDGYDPSVQVQLDWKLERMGDHMLMGHAFLMPFQHHEASSHTLHSAFWTP